MVIIDDSYVRAAQRPKLIVLITVSLHNLAVSTFHEYGAHFLRAEGVLLYYKKKQKKKPKQYLTLGNNFHCFNEQGILFCFCSIITFKR